MNSNAPLKLYGVGLVMPGADSTQDFRKKFPSWSQNHRNLPPAQAPFGFDPALFPSGYPDWSFEKFEKKFLTYFPQKKFEQIKRKIDQRTFYILDAFLQILDQNQNLINQLTSNNRVGIFLSSAFGPHLESRQASLIFEQAQRNWNEFWSQPENNSKRREAQKRKDPKSTPPPLENLGDVPQRAAWCESWAQQSPELQCFLKKLKNIEEWGVDEKKGHDKLTLMRLKQRARQELINQWNSPQPPWTSVDPRLIWNLPNGAASQISILLGCQGPAFFLGGACSSFLLSLQEGIKHIQSGEGDWAFVGATEDPPCAESISAFYQGRLLAAGDLNHPLTTLRGTRISGGSCLWLIGKEGLAEDWGVSPLGVEISSDAHHIITPSAEGPLNAVKKVFAKTERSPQDCVNWDLHATGTPGDLSELELCQKFLPTSTILSARKGLFGHGLGVCGGWEATAQILSFQKIQNRWHILGNGLSPEELHAQVQSQNLRLALNEPLPLPFQSSFLLGKISLGVGGITAASLLEVDPEKVQQRFK